MENSLVLIKPDAVERNLIGKILNKYEEAGLKITSLKMAMVTEDLAGKHYEEHKEKPFYGNLIEYITRSPLCALIVSGDEAISKVREINGATDPQNAAEGTIRKLYAISKSENCVHASDSKVSAEREIDIWFSKAQ